MCGPRAVGWLHGLMDRVVTLWRWPVPTVYWTWFIQGGALGDVDVLSRTSALLRVPGDVLLGI